MPNTTGLGARGAVMFLLTLALAGCANTTTGNTSEEGSAQTPEAEATPAETPAPASEPEEQAEENTENESGSEEENDSAPDEETNEGETEASPEGGGGFCTTHTCIPSYDEGHGYPVECADGEWSKSGGISGACSDHGGEKE